QVAERSIAAEELVASGSGERHLETGVAHDATHEVRVDGVEGRLIERLERSVELGDEAGLRQPKIGVLGAERLRDRTRVHRFVEVDLVEGNVERLDARAPGANGK